MIGAALWFIVAYAEVVPEWLMPVVTRAGVTGLASLILLGLFTLVIPQSSHELYDPDAAWSLDLVDFAAARKGRRLGAGELVVLVGPDARGLDRRVDRVALSTHHAPRDAFHHAERDEYV